MLTSTTGATADDDPLLSPWPGDDQRTAIGVTCSGFADNTATVVMWKFGEDQIFEEFHSVFLDRALASSLGSGTNNPEAFSGPCTERLQWSGDYRKALFSFLPDADKPVKHVGLIDLETEKVIDLTAMRQDGEDFGEKILSETAATFELVGDPGSYSVDDNSVIISPDEKETYPTEGEATNVRVPIDDPDHASPAEQEDSRDNWFEPLVFDGDWTSEEDQYSLGGRWIATDSGAVEDSTADGIEIAPSDNYRQSKKIACTGEGAVVGWLNDSQLIVWDGKKLFPLTVAQSGKAQCGESLLPSNDYSIADVKLSPDGRFVYLGWVKGAAEKSYRVSTLGGKAVPASVPKPPEELTMFPRAPMSDER